jgi:hypothetical protein
VGGTSHEDTRSACQLGREPLLGGMSSMIALAGTELEVQCARISSEAVGVNS